MSAAVGRRLREERIRLDASQEAFAQTVGASKRALIEWEKGATSPKVCHLARWDEIGLDVLYVVTGRREQAEAQKVGRVEVRLRVDEVKLSSLTDECLSQFEARLNAEDIITVETRPKEGAPEARPQRPVRSTKWSLASFLGLNSNRREG
ncbi:hypothetical protein [Maricaulis sp. W15]|uniref:hypothetical protein n=1 Tax=Maricaulis sp. W15 TaxID=1772333 RepID=UPI00117EEE84|nr:hypothetical protein [Maricaulis sp. W15]